METQGLLVTKLRGIIFCDLLVVSCELSAASCQLRLASCQLRVVSCEFVFHHVSSFFLPQSITVMPHCMQRNSVSKNILSLDIKAFFCKRISIELRPFPAPRASPGHFPRPCACFSPSAGGKTFSPNSQNWGWRRKGKKLKYLLKNLVCFLYNLRLKIGND